MLAISERKVYGIQQEIYRYTNVLQQVLILFSFILWISPPRHILHVFFYVSNPIQRYDGRNQIIKCEMILKQFIANKIGEITTNRFPSARSVATLESKIRTHCTCLAARSIATLGQKSVLIASKCEDEDDQVFENLTFSLTFF